MVDIGLSEIIGSQWVISWLCFRDQLCHVRQCVWLGEVSYQIGHKEHKVLKNTHTVFIFNEKAQTSFQSSLLGRVATVLNFICRQYIFVLLTVCGITKPQFWKSVTLVISCLCCPQVPFSSLLLKGTWGRLLHGSVIGHDTIKWFQE